MEENIQFLTLTLVKNWRGATRGPGKRLEGRISFCPPVESPLYAVSRVGKHIEVCLAGPCPLMPPPPCRNATVYRDKRRKAH